LAWLRSNDAADENPMDLMSIASFQSAGTMPLPGGSAAPAMGGLDWMRDKTAAQMALDDPSVSTYGNKPRGPMTEEEKKAAAMGDALNWLRSSEAGVDGLDDPDALAKMLAAEADGFGAPLSSEAQRAQDMSNALNWLSRDDSADPGRALPPTLPISAETSAAASRDSTFSSIRVNASIEVDPVSPPNISLTFCVD